MTGLIAANATGLLVNTATVTAPAGALDPDTANNTATSSVTLAPSADLHITKEGPLNAVAGTNVVYTIAVMNAGPSDATGVTLADPTPPGLTFVANAGDCTTAFPCDLGTLPRATTRTITATFAVPSGYTTPNPIANTATVSSPTPPAISTERDHQHAGRRAGDRSPHHEHQRRQRRGRRAADDLHHHRHQPARAERREWRHGHRHVPGDADRRDVDLCRRRGRRLRRRGERRHQHARDRAGGRDASSSPRPARSIPRPPANSSTRHWCSRRSDHANRTSAIATDRDAIGTEADVAITKTVDQASIVAGNTLVYTITVTNSGPSTPRAWW